MSMKFPKETEKAKRKKHPQSIVYCGRFCYLCDRIGMTEEHHIFGGPNRQKSEEYGLTVRLCPSCHRIGDQAVHFNQKIMDYMHLRGQQAFEAKHSHEEFMKEFGRNYITDELVEEYGNPYKN